MNQPIPVDRIHPCLFEHFGISDMIDVQLVLGGYRCQNIAFTCAGKRFFLKQYRGVPYNSTHEVKQAEVFFASRGIPAIMPIIGHDGQSAFLFEDAWYSLFPFVEGRVLKPSELTPHHLASMGKMLGMLHRIGETADLNAFSRFSFWDRQAFLADVERVKREIDPAHLNTTAKRLAYENLMLQAGYVQRTPQEPADFHLPYNTLLHGDYIYTNMFFHEDGSIRDLYDFERAGIGPRAHELVRSILISCFDDGWNEKNFEFARVYLKAYQTVYPISRDEFEQGVRMYTTHFMHMSWIEVEVLLGGSELHGALVGPANARMHHFLGDLQDIIQRIFVK